MAEVWWKMSAGRMINQSTLQNPVLINTIGHAAGALLFGFIIMLLVRDGRTRGIRESKLSILAAGLAFAWNIGSLIALGTGDPGSLAMRIVMTVSFAVLSLLPAVLLQVALRGRLRVVARTGYAVSVIAMGLHVAELFVTSPVPHQVALLLVALGFALLTLIAAMVTPRTEWLALACLLLFASSFPHFGYQHFQSPWAAEITWHHLGIPVALVVLLQDYRFLLLDTFVRFLMNSALAAAYVTGILVLNQKFQLLRTIGSSAFYSGVALVGICVSLILFAHVRTLSQQWVGRAIFHRQNLEDRIRAIAQISASARSEAELISRAAGEVAGHFRADRFEVAPTVSKGEIELAWVEAEIPLRFSNGEMSVLLIGPRHGRQRYLSEDLEDIQRLASAIVEQVERFRAEELKRLAARAELRALQAQINPHFLFNAFNTLYGTIDRESTGARRLVLNLTEIFRYFLQADRSVIALSEELRIVKAYLEIEAQRLGDRLEIVLNVSEPALAVMIPILSIQPLIENAVKHGVARKAGRGRVTVNATVEAGTLQVMIEDESFGVPNARQATHDGYGVGLANVRRRLNLSYGASSSLEVSHGLQGSMVKLAIPVGVPSPAVA